MATNIATARSEAAVLSTNKLIRNTYTLLAMTLIFSTFTASLSIVLQVPSGIAFGSFIGGIVLVWFVLPRYANSAAGIGVVFAVTGLLGLGLGPMLTQYLALPNGPQIVATALGGTGVIFLGLSGYALTTRRDFSFLGGFLFVGFLVVIGAMLVNIFLHIPALSLALSAVIIMLMSGFILYDTSRMINGGQTNYVLATISLYLSIFNIFINLLHLLGFAGDD
ncbi:MAG: Bax inhibitor-1/YccA family protein [Gammaproteobacteria bacterium]|nr:Bax inhibitor-1/YccA family protein [Gammaproteobacteria bacterium]MCZ6894655.1 Bax inhibitor-1/YccA family protein [Gammaproteobacteria bacterium]